MKAVRVQHVSVNCEGQLDETRRDYAELFEMADAERSATTGASRSTT